jgi:transposase
MLTVFERFIKLKITVTMAKPEQLNQQLQERKTRYFSEDFKRKKVTEMERRITTISEICKVYQVSRPAVYKWVYKYSLMKKKAVKMVVESESDTAKIKALKEHIDKLEQLLGQKQFTIEFMEKQMQIATENHGVEFKKKASGKPSSGIGGTDQNMGTK